MQNIKTKSGILQHDPQYHSIQEYINFRIYDSKNGKQIDRFAKTMVAAEDFLLAFKTEFETCKLWVARINDSVWKKEDPNNWVGHFVIQVETGDPNSIDASVRFNRIIELLWQGLQGKQIKQGSMIFEIVRMGKFSRRDF